MLQRVMGSERRPRFLDVGLEPDEREHLFCCLCCVRCPVGGLSTRLNVVQHFRSVWLRYHMYHERTGAAAMLSLVMTLL